MIYKLFNLKIILRQMSQDNNLRKSKRQPVPNRMYSEGIIELKKESNIRNKKKNKNDEDYYSYSESQRHEQPLGTNNTYPTAILESQQPFLLCVFPDGYQRRIQFVVQSKQDKTPKKEIIKSVSVSRPVKRQEPSQSLLSIFEQAIQHAEIIGEVSEEDSKKDLSEFEEPRIPTPPIKIKKHREQSDSRIKKLTIKDNIMEINHSIKGNISIPLNWKVPEKIEIQMSAEELELKRKIEESKELKNISIFIR